MIEMRPDLSGKFVLGSRCLSLKISDLYKKVAEEGCFESNKKGITNRCEKVVKT